VAGPEGLEPNKVCVRTTYRGQCARWATCSIQLTLTGGCSPGTYTFRADMTDTTTSQIIATGQTHLSQNGQFTVIQAKFPSVSETSRDPKPTVMPNVTSSRPSLALSSLCNSNHVPQEQRIMLSSRVSPSTRVMLPRGNPPPISSSKLGIPTRLPLR